MKKLISTLLLLAVISFQLVMPANRPVPDDYRCRFYHAFITGEMSNWPKWIDELEIEYRKQKSPKVLYEIVLAHYGLIAYLIGSEQDEKAEEYIQDAEEYLPELKSYESYRSDGEALQGAIIAYKIGINKARAVFLGPRSIRHINKALELDPHNPYGWVEKGNAEFHMPRYFGGSYEQAARYFEKAIKYFEDNQGNLNCNWVYLNTLAWLAQSYEKSDQERKAQSTYEKILQIEPHFKWVKEELYPEFRNR